MSVIKSALELALEKTANIKIDPEKLAVNKSVAEGREAAALFLSYDINREQLAEKMDNHDTERKNWFLNGIFKTFNDNLTLPNSDSYQEALQRLLEGFTVVFKDNTASVLQQELNALFGDYLAGKEQLQVSLEQQFQMQMGGKMAELSQQLGYAVKMDFRNDPNFLKAYNENMNSLAEQFKEPLAQLKDSLNERFRQTWG